MSVTLEYSTASIVLATISVVGFLLLYKKTVKTPFLLMGMAVYLKLLFCSFGLLSEFVFAIPEFILTLWLVIEFKIKIKWIAFIILAFSIFYVYWVWFPAYEVMGLPALFIMMMWGVWYFYNRRRELKNIG